MDEKIIFSMVIPFILLLAIFQKITKKPYPPGPRGWPIIGSMNMVDKLTHRSLAALAERYGGVLHLRIGFRHMIAVSTPSAAHEVLQLHDQVFSNRPATIAIAYLTYDRADMAFANYGPFWRQMRKLCVMKLFSRRRAESWDSVRDGVDGMVRRVASRAAAEARVNVGEAVFGLMRDVIYRAAFGSAAAGEGQDEFLGILQEFSKLFGAFNAADFIPWSRWIDPQGLNGRLISARKQLDGFIDRIIDDHAAKKNGNAGGESDMVDELMAFYGGDEEVKVSESENLQNSIKLTRNNIKAIIMDVMFGGTETVASAIEWAMAELLKSPKDLKRAQQELEDVVGLDRKVDESDIENLPFLRCCLKEVLRLHPPIPLLLHETAAAAVISGYHIPAKSRVMINAWAIGRDPGAWEDPESFNPTRFLNDDAPDFKGADFEFLPFGSGRRSCPGMQLGLYAMEVAVAHLLHCFTWELPDGMKPSEMDMSDVFGLTAPRAIRLVAVPTPRLMCPL